jgi:hypothetical protein
MVGDALLALAMVGGGLLGLGLCLVAVYVAAWVADWIAERVIR